MNATVARLSAQARGRVTANAKAIGGAAQITGLVIVVLVSAYSDVMFVALMWSAFPGGFLTYAAVGGAFAASVSIIALMIGKKRWFRPGPQLVFAWWFTGAELAISITNVIVAVLVSKHQVLGNWQTYIDVAPATPLVALTGWIIISYLDPARAAAHERMEMEDDQRQLELEHERELFGAQMNLQDAFLKHYAACLQDEVQSVEMQAAIQHGAATLAAKKLEELTGEPVLPRRLQPSVRLSQSIDTATEEEEETPKNAQGRPLKPLPKTKS